MELKSFDASILVAKKETGFSLYLVKWGNAWRYALNDELSLNDFDPVGDIYENKTEFVTKAYDYARSQGFTDKEILGKYPRKTFVELTNDEITALNTAKFLIKDSISDHAEQCYVYLNKILDKIKFDN